MPPCPYPAPGLLTLHLPYRACPGLPYRAWGTRDRQSVMRKKKWTRRPYPALALPGLGDTGPSVSHACAKEKKKKRTRRPYPALALPGLGDTGPSVSHAQKKSGPAALTLHLPYTYPALTLHYGRRSARRRWERAQAQQKTFCFGRQFLSLLKYDNILV